MNDSLTFQQKFVAQLKSVVSPHISIVDELADLLGISTDSVYRRLRCQSAFSFDEVALIAQTFGVSLDGMLGNPSKQVSFQFSPMYSEPVNFENYFRFFSNYLNELAGSKGTRIIYAAQDVPVFRHFSFPNLSAFKNFYWSKAVLNHPNFAGQKFNPSVVPAAIIEMNKQTFKTYRKISRTEIWSEETLSSTLKQVEFFWDSGLFEDREQALTVTAELHQMMLELEQECETGLHDTADDRADFKLYNSEVFIGNNSVYIDPGNSGHEARVFLGYNTFNSINTYNAALARETMHWVENLIKKSVLLSGTGEKQRAIFFNKMKASIQALEKHIEKP